jgi:hypothetical protein
MNDGHMAVWEAENTAPTAWDYWVAAVERMLAHDLDGDQVKDGYSLDWAYEMFREGLTPEQGWRRVEHEKMIVRRLSWGRP